MSIFLRASVRAICTRMHIRAAAPDDAPDVAEVHVRAWQVGYRGLLPDAYLDGLRAADRAARYDFGNADPSRPKTLVATEDDRVIGFVTTMPGADDSGAPIGIVAALYVHPDAWGRGVGRALIAEGRRRLVDLGLHGACLWVLEGNVRAERLYELDGWRADGTVRVESVWGIVARDRRFRRDLL